MATADDRVWVEVTTARARVRGGLRCQSRMCARSYAMAGFVGLWCETVRAGLKGESSGAVLVVVVVVVAGTASPKSVGGGGSGTGGAWRVSVLNAGRFVGKVSAPAPAPEEEGGGGRGGKDEEGGGGRTRREGGGRNDWGEGRGRRGGGRDEGEGGLGVEMWGVW